MKDPSGQDEPFEGGSATRRQLSRSADTLRACRRGTASNSTGPKARGDNWLCVPAPAAPQRRRSDASVELRETDDAAIEGGMVAAGRGRKGKRAEYRCVACGYAVVVHGQPPSCPMCRRGTLGACRVAAFLAATRLPNGTRSTRRYVHLGVDRQETAERLQAPFFANGRLADPPSSPGVKPEHRSKMLPRRSLRSSPSPGRKRSRVLPREEGSRRLEIFQGERGCLGVALQHAPSYAGRRPSFPGVLGQPRRSSLLARTSDRF